MFQLVVDNFYTKNEGESNKKSLCHITEGKKKELSRNFASILKKLECFSSLLFRTIRLDKVVDST